MNRLIATFVALLVLLVLCPTAAADDLYLPAIANRDSLQTATGIAVDFALADARLWDIYESSGRPGMPVQCGQAGRVQVHVFKVGGDIGPGSRIDGVSVRVVHYADGQVQEETLVTGGGGQPGQVTFALDGWAEIQLVTQSEGLVAGSKTVVVSAYPGTVDYQQLQKSLYCSDHASCTALVQSNACSGKLSWNLVFTRTY
jgi:hypothetical protein